MSASYGRQIRQFDNRLCRSTVAEAVTWMALQEERERCGRSGGASGGAVCRGAPVGKDDFHGRLDASLRKTRWCCTQRSCRLGELFAGNQTR
jgi:hypothetical protein